MQQLNLVEDQRSLGAKLDRERTARVLDVLRGIEGLELQFKRTYFVPADRESVFKEYLARALADVLGMHHDLIIGHDIRFYPPKPDLRDFPRDRNLYPTAQLNLYGKTGNEIIQIGFSTMEGYDTGLNYRLVVISNQAGGAWNSLPDRWKLSDTYWLEVTNPMGDSVLPAQLKVRAFKRARHIAEQLMPVLPARVKVS